jgi:aminopeptidase N
MEHRLSDQGPSSGIVSATSAARSRVFRALVYNRRGGPAHVPAWLVGDEEFFRGLRRFYRESRFRKVGTDDFRVAMEKETGKTLNRFSNSGSSVRRSRG